MAKDFYSPREISFTRQQALWLIWHLPELSEGYWPVDASSYDLYIGKKKTGKYRAYFETPVEYAAEIEIRLERAGLDGLVLLCIECFGMSAISLSKYLNIPEWSILKRRRKALGFISGWKRKDSYKIWRNSGHHRS